MVQYKLVISGGSTMP